MKHCLTLVGFKMSLFFDSMLGCRQSPSEIKIGPLKCINLTPPPVTQLAWTDLGLRCRGALVLLSVSVTFTTLLYYAALEHVFLTAL